MGKKKCQKYKQMYNDYMANRENKALLQEIKEHILTCSHLYCMTTSRMIAICAYNGRHEDE